jgi:hypothetical protein
MALVITIDSNTIPDGDIKSYPVARNVAEFNNNLIASEMDIVLDNTDGSYSDTNVLSIFYGVNWVDKEVTVYDDKLELYTWKGRIKNLVQDDGNKTLTVKTANYVRDLVDITCVYSGSAITPAAAVYNILTTLIGVPVSYIQYDGFQDAIARQTAGSGTIVITFTADDNKSCMSVIQELLRMSHCVLYSVNNILHLWQWRAWDGVLGTRIGDHELIPGTFKSEYDFMQYNAYSIYWNNGGTATLRSVTKAGTDGEKKFVVPDENVESTTAANYRILLAAQAGADYYGVMAYTRYANPTKKCSFTLDDSMRELAPNEQVDITSGDFVGEPVRLTSVVYDPNNRTVACEGIFLNLPVNVVSRDETPPEAPGIIEVLPLHNGIFVKWTANTETDLLGYRLYLSAGSPGSWNGLMTNLGPSPIDVRNPSLSVDGYCYKEIYELVAGATYYVKATAYDTSFNESEDSNIMAGYALPYTTDNENLYSCDGDLYSGITLAILNPHSGTVPADGTDFTLYDSDYYDMLYLGPTAIYESLILWNGAGETVSSIVVKGFADRVDDIKVQWAEYDPVTDSLGTWSALVSCVGTCILSPGKEYVELRFVFYSTSWSDTDKALVTEIN